MHHIVKIWIVMALLLLGGCSAAEPRPIKLPTDIAEVSDKFVDAIKRGDMKSARKYVDSDSLSDFDEHIKKDGQLRGNFSRVKPYYVRRTPQGFGNLIEKEASVIYAAEKNGKWTVLEIDVFWPDEGSAKVQSWYTKTDGAMPRDLRTQMEMQRTFRYGSIAMAILLAAFLAFFVWLIKRKPTLVSPDASGERRAAAVTTRRDGDAE